MIFRSLLLGIFLISVGILNAQEIELAGIFRNEKNGAVIPFATIEIMNKKIGIAADYKGNFNLKIPQSCINDSLRCKSLGFETKWILVKTFQKDFSNVVINLTPVVYTLNEVEIFGPPAGKYRLGNYVKSTKGGGFLTNIQTQLAVYMDSRKYNNARIVNASFYLSKGGKPETPFRVRLYAVDSKTGNPGDDLIKDNIIIHGKHRGGWVTVDLSKYNLKAPGNGYFVSMEWINSGDQYYYQTYIGPTICTCYGQVCASITSIPISNTWTYVYGVGWFKDDNKILHHNEYLNTLITSEIEVSK